MDCSRPGFPVFHYLLEFAQTHVHWVSDAIQPPHPLLLLLLLPSIFPSIRVFSNEPVFCIRWPKYWSFSFSISSFNEYSGLISFRMDWLDLLAVQGTLKSLLQHHSSEASILQHSAFFTVQLSHPYMTTGKTIALTILLSDNIWIALLSGVPKTTLRLDASLGLPRIRSCEWQLQFMAIKGQKTKSAKGKGMWGKVQEKPGAAYVSHLMVSRGTTLNSPSKDWCNTG